MVSFIETIVYFIETIVIQKNPSQFLMSQTLVTSNTVRDFFEITIVFYITIVHVICTRHRLTKLLYSCHFTDPDSGPTTLFKRS